MLSHLSIRDIVLIEKLDMEFSRGLSVLTGETGAGKSILLDALSLALGARGDAGLVRHGAAQGQITAVFDLAESHPARAVLRANDFDDNGELVLRRVQAAVVAGHPTRLVAASGHDLQQLTIPLIVYALQHMQ